MMIIDLWLKNDERRIRVGHLNENSHLIDEHDGENGLLDQLGFTEIEE